jgi:gluconokinase
MMSCVSHSIVNHTSNASPAFVLALDIGTSGIRGALYDSAGEEIDGTSVRNALNLLTTISGGAEFDADEAIAEVARTIDDVIARAASLVSTVKLVTIACFWHSLVGVDQNGRAVTPVFGWADTRAAQMIGELQRSFDERETHARTGCRFHPSYWPAKLQWLRHQDEVLYHSARWMSLSELLMQRFFGETPISISMASGTGLFDQRKCEWDCPLLSYLGIRLDQLPVVAKDGTFLSGLATEYARRWPILKEAKWFLPIGDGAANNIGAGCATVDRAALMIGTSGAMRVMWSGGVPQTIPKELWCYRVDSKRVVIGGALSDGGGLFGWMRRALAIDGNDEEIERAINKLGPDEHGLTVLPFWAGERSTGWHASARGTISGLSQDTEPIEILRAAMESIAYRFALIASSLKQITPLTAIIASGGALRSSQVWMQMIADVLGRSISLSDTHEASSRGAVLLALEMEGKIGDIADLPGPIECTYEPDMVHHARYLEGLERQEKLYANLIT